MSRHYTVIGQDTLTNADTVVSLLQVSEVLGYMYEIQAGSRVTPVDQIGGYEVIRFTDNGTSTPVTPSRKRKTDPDKCQNRPFFEL